MPIAAGETFAGYTIVRLLGTGGMGEVYLAEHPRLPRRDALKVLPTDVCADSEYRQRFNREADLAATLWHPHIIGVHDRGDVDGQIWISMDYVDGTDAAELLRERYPNGMPKDEVVRIVTGVAEALDYAHQQGLLHRDVKPANIMLTDPADAGEQRVLLGDFGIARRMDDNSNLTATNMTVGTVFYAAPEQLMGEDIDGRADQYALAATAFHLLTGSPPFHHSNPTVVISQHLTAAPPTLAERRPELSALDPVLRKALSKDPKDRFVNCVDFARALCHRLGVEPYADTEQTAPSIPIRRNHGGGKHEAPSSREPLKRRFLRPTILIPGILAVLLLVAIALVLIQFREIEKLLNDEYTPPPSPSPPATSPRAEAPPPAPPPPPATTTTTVTAAPAAAVVGADCSPVGSTATTANGNTVYCSTLQTTGASIWSTVQGEVPAPTVTVTPDATDEPLPVELESPVRVCMQETDKTRRECREAIRASNEAGS
ncbi:serine/threonine protein kinase [Mycolicibacterium agri]|uniref:non-specific serine/threonine protein kinase n=1 Tax=Mycolicibacterium agri TaxID=36811 RepID=A0A2A7N2V4_MYCAG|nr:serine/threonine-protein kinase [Mycolicibacterium agri]PEG38087.1 serine/threonine protein kinase [Mycolicibacterium agri]GFG48850.1 serine/threonine-protein kinase PknF [Mycolicibacterium agri]